MLFLSPFLSFGYCIFVLQCLTFESNRNNILKVLWTYLHFGPLERVVVFFPSPPCHSFAIDLTWKVQAIQIGGVTIFVPPGAFIYHGTVGRILVVITIPGTECHTTVRSKRISCGSCKFNPTNRGFVRVSRGIHF